MNLYRKILSMAFDPLGRPLECHFGRAWAYAQLSRPVFRISTARISK